MILAILTFFTALSISAVAAYFSVAGLIAIFAAAPIPIAIMGCSLEAAKLVTASWLYRNWAAAPSLIKIYLSLAIVVLSLITSMGIFGYLSKAATEHTSVAGSNQINIEILNQRELVVKSRIEFILKQDNKTTFASNRINRDLNEAQKELKGIIEEKSALLQVKNKIDTELGPLKYITEFFYGKSDEKMIDRAIRWVIVLLIFVFDPLAILLTIAANMSLKQAVEKDEMQFTEFIPETKPVPVSTKTAAPAKRNWNKDLYKRTKNEEGVNISPERIQTIPKEILDKVFKKK